MTQQWYKKSSVQAALVSAIAVVATTLNTGLSLRLKRNA